MAGRGHRSRLMGYVVLLAASSAVIVGALLLGSGSDPPLGVAGTYAVSQSTCFREGFVLQQSGRYLALAGPEEHPGDVGGSLELRDGLLAGDVTCADGSVRAISGVVEGRIVREEGRIVEGPDLRLTVGGQEEQATFVVTRPEEEGITFEEREPENTLGRLMLAIAVVLIAGRLVGAGVARIGQPRVMGEVLAGILLGPTLFASVAPGLQAYIFPPDIVHLLRGAADIGLVFYMFLVGLELDPKLLEGRVEQAAFISNAGIAVPMALGIAVAVPLFGVIGPSTSFAPFAVFMGVAMSITAFPVLARILIERRMLKGAVGSMAIASAAIDDVSAWVLLALATAIAEAATSGSGGNVPLTLAQVVGLAVVFCAVMGLGVRRAVARVSVAYDEAGYLSGGWTAAIFLGVLLSAYVAAQIPIAGIFGAFVMGLIMPRHAGLTHDVTRRVEDFVVTLLLPLFFVVAGLNVRLGLLNTPLLWGITLLLLLIAVLSKWAGAMAAGRYLGMRTREAAALGALMNTRGLTELIVLSIGLSFGVITPAIYTMLVIMALVTTFMTGPALRLIDRDGTLVMPAEAEVEAAQPSAPARVVERPERTILVAALDARNLDALLGLAVPLASSEPQRELLVVRPLEPSRIVTGLSPLERDLEEAEAQLRLRRPLLQELGVWTRTAAFTSAEPGADLLRLASEERVDLVVLDGRRPLVGEGPPGGAVGQVLERAEPDVAVLIERDGELDLGPDRPVTVAFGGGPHDWTALELGAWIATMAEAPLVLLGNEADLQEGRRDASHLLANASLVVQNLVGIPATPRLVPPGREGILEAARGAGLLILGLSDRWREEGLGEVRSAIARSAPAPTLFVRHGTRPGALAPPEDATRYTWSRTGQAGPGRPLGR